MPCKGNYGQETLTTTTTTRSRHGTVVGTENCHLPPSKDATEGRRSLPETSFVRELQPTFQIEVLQSKQQSTSDERLCPPCINSNHVTTSKRLRLLPDAVRSFGNDNVVRAYEHRSERRRSLIYCRASFTRLFSIVRTFHVTF